MKIKLTLSILFATVFLSACGSTQKKIAELEVSPTGLQAVVASSADGVIIPAIENWQQASTSFYLQTEQFCKKPSSPALKQLQAGWKHLSLKWNQTIMYDFGPLRDNLFSAKVNFVESMRQRGKNYDKTVASRLNQRLNDTKKLDSAYFVGLNFNLVGMSALEQMVFSDFTTQKTDTGSIVSNYRQHRRSCELLVGLSRLNSDIADYVLDGWHKKSRGSKKSYRELFAKNQLINGEKSLTKLIFSVQDYFRYIKQRKLEGRLDAKLSAMTFTNMIAGLEAIEQLFTGKGSNLSLQKYLQASDNKSVADIFLKTLQTAKTQAKLKDREAMKRTYTKLVKMLEKDIPKGLGVDFGMNFTDGD
jgi:predicted lipoprotein